MKHLVFCVMAVAVGLLVGFSLCVAVDAGTQPQEHAANFDSLHVRHQITIGDKSGHQIQITASPDGSGIWLTAKSGDCVALVNGFRQPPQVGIGDRDDIGKGWAAGLSATRGDGAIQLRRGGSIKIVSAADFK